MKLIDLLSVLDESVYLEVFADDYMYIYDGRDAIPEELNDREVLTVTHFTRGIAVIVR